MPENVCVQQKLFLWNHRIHEYWAKERLYYWSLSFEPTYNQARVFACIDSLAKEKGITSYIIYETSGDIDIFLRIWLPATLTVEDFKKELETRLTPAGLSTSNSFIVTSTIMHWVWSNTGDQPSEPSKTVLAKPDEALVNKVNQGSISGDELSELQQQHIVAPVDFKKGIKFIIVISPFRLNPLRLAVNGLENKIKDILQNVNNIFEVSFYSGSGFGSYIIQGRVDPTSFESVNDEIIRKINDVGLQSFFGVRTYTRFVVNPFVLNEALPTIPRPSDSRPIEAFLAEEESGSLEFKGSFAFDLREWAATDKLQKSQKLIKEGIARTIVGFLNARKGGTVIIGILEENKFRGKDMQVRISRLPRIGHYLIYGLETDLEGKEWDAFSLKVLDVLKGHIDPNPTIWLTITKESIYNRDLCVIAVRPQTDNWFYLKDDPHFYVREGNRTAKYSGKEADYYKSSSLQKS